MTMRVNFNVHGSLSSQRTKKSSNAKHFENNGRIDRAPVTDTVSFQGLTKQLSHHTYIDGQKDIKEIVHKHQGKSMTLGQLPDFVQAKFPKDKREECIKEFYKTFEQITEELRSFDETKVFTIDEITKRRNNSTKELFKNLLNKYNLAAPWDDVDIVYLGKGGKGTGYKLEGLKNPNFDEDEYVLKVYHTIEGKNWQPYKSHGNYAENNSAAYWMKNAGYNTQRGKYLFGDLKTGYMVLKFVDDDVRLPKIMKDPYHYGLKCTDENAEKKHNVCKNYSYDWGGVRVVNRIKNGSKTARTVLKEIKETPDKYKEQEWWRIYSSRKMDKSQKFAGLAMAIKYMPDKEIYIDKCIKLNDPLVDSALAYVLKYLPFEKAIKYFEKLVNTDDITTQVILFNEIPLLAMKHRDNNIKDDLQSVRSEILPSRIMKYYDVSEKYAKPESIEHLASFVHLLPKEHFRSYYKHLAQNNNKALSDRLIYKLSNIEQENKLFAINCIAKNLEDIELKKRLLIAASSMPPEKFVKIENILGITYDDVKKEI